MTVYCDYCGHKAALVDDSEIYGRSFGHTAYLCRNCGAYVGCHGRTDKPLGRLADATLRKWKMAAHASFDPLWKPGRSVGGAKPPTAGSLDKWDFRSRRRTSVCLTCLSVRKSSRLLKKEISKMLNFDKKDAHVYPFDESPGAGIIMDVDLEQLIRESERLRVCEAILHSKTSATHSKPFWECPALL